LRSENGLVKVPTGPGLGVDMDPDFVKKYKVMED
jgi:L-alanine-DL-glutamate epimerase-like enolase superfamily enzyme